MVHGVVKPFNQEEDRTDDTFLRYTQSAGHVSGEYQVAILSKNRLKVQFDQKIFSLFNILFLAGFQQHELLKMKNVRHDTNFQPNSMSMVLNNFVTVLRA